ncbi:unnamed protein product [Pseudo-nitzschia multistriata]|uniref:SAP domain-containing protein n=1 Tax=Pseudo-nitzschia multistriata TaxID=183589 RepID=A0A448Z6K9_9STRA|nr:unnamed protein product [Pseudo-nitzschia multistriata]
MYALAYLCQNLWSNQCPQHLVKALLPEYPSTFERIRRDVHTRTLSKEGINHSNFNQNFNNNNNKNKNKNNKDPNFIPAHEQLLSSTSRREPGNIFSGFSPSQSDVSPLPSPATTNITPLKVMIFIDGTWLYYSIYERSYERDVIAQKLGKYWRAELTPDWSRLPTVACQALLEDPKSKWSAIMPIGADASNESPSPSTTTVPARPIEVSRVSVYSSMHRDTPKDSFRYKMFADMMKAGFDVNMMETVGKGEKCVDIQLAVDMLYYATVPDAYDVALLLTGDRDFLPAVIRCRQKGRRIGLVSMRTGSLAFEDTPNLKDYDTIWMEDYLSKWIREKTPQEMVSMNGLRGGKRPFSSSTNGTQQLSQISAHTLNKVITNFIEKSGAPRVSSRDMGRHLKALTVGERSMLDEIKAVYGGLYQFLVLAEIYRVEADSRRAFKAFWVSMQIDSKMTKKEERVRDEDLSDNEKKFLTMYEQWVPTDKNKEYHFTMTEPDLKKSPQLSDISSSRVMPESLEDESPSVDYTALTVPELKEICRKRGLKVSAKKKIELIERIEASVSSEMQEPEIKVAESSPEKYLQSLVLEYLHASGGQASSRDVGRYLAANKVSYERRRIEGSMAQRMSALLELKEIYGSLNAFVKNVHYLYTTSGEGHEFNICIDKDSRQKLS